jgi:hypothetical protein
MNSHQRRVAIRKLQINEIIDNIYPWTGFETFKEAQILKICEATGMTREQYLEYEKLEKMRHNKL